MDKCAHGRWPGHRIRKPDVQWNLGRLPCCPKKQKKCYPKHCPIPRRYGSRSTGEDILKLQTSEECEDQKNCNQKSEVTDSIDDECFLCGIACRRRAGLVSPCFKLTVM